MLIVMTQASRCHSISLLSLDNYIKDGESYNLFYNGLLKQTRKGKRNPSLKLCRFAPDPDICVYSTLSEYIKRTSSLRRNESNLIISYIKPHKAVVTTTISRWIRIVMRNSGIDIDQFGAHSARGAVASKAKQNGLPVAEIMKVAGWSTSETFARFYDKPLNIDSSSSFQNSTLQ